MLKLRPGTLFLRPIVTLLSLQLPCMGITSTLKVTRPPAPTAGAHGNMHTMVRFVPSYLWGLLGTHFPGRVRLHPDSFWVSMAAMCLNPKCQNTLSLQWRTRIQRVLPSLCVAPNANHFLFGHSQSHHVYPTSSSITNKRWPAANLSYFIISLAQTWAKDQHWEGSSPVKRMGCLPIASSCLVWHSWGSHVERIYAYI